MQTNDLSHRKTRTLCFDWLSRERTHSKQSMSVTNIHIHATTTIFRCMEHNNTSSAIGMCKMDRRGERAAMPQLVISGSTRERRVLRESSNQSHTQDINSGTSTFTSVHVNSTRGRTLRSSIKDTCKTKISTHRQPCISTSRETATRHTSTPSSSTQTRDEKFGGKKDADGVHKTRCHSHSSYITRTRWNAAHCFPCANNTTFWLIVAMSGGFGLRSSS